MQRHLAAVFSCALATLVATSALASLPSLHAQGMQIGFAEEWALATDRAKVLEQLIPGTPAYYYYNCRYLQDTGALDKVDALLGAWIERHGRTNQVVEIQNRQALLSFAANSRKTFAYLKERLHLGFDHQRESSAAKRDLPTALDPGLVSAAAFARQALKKHPRTVKGFRDSALESLLASNLTDDLLMDVLRRLRRPDVPNLPARIVRNLQSRRGRSFGSLPVHGLLLREQLEECVRLDAKLLNNSRFVEIYLRRLLPGDDVNWARNAQAREAYLDRLQAFAGRLAPTHNSLKAHVLYHRLRHDLEAGKPDRERFRAYLRLPRRSNHANQDYLRRHLQAGHGVNANSRFPTGFGSIGNDDKLVRTYFMHFFRTEDSYEAYTEMVRSEYLRRVFAETKILAGEGDMERWYSLLDDPGYYERLKDRVEIEFAPTQRRAYSATEPVTLEVDVKNVNKLLIKVFEINTLNYYQALAREVDASINLDGLIANEELTREYDEGALRRVRRRFDLATLQKPGVYVVELIGNGLSSRAVIHKGQLQYTERQGAAGHVFTVRDEAGNPLADAAIWFGGKRYSGDARGEIALPYSTKPGTRPLILLHGPLASLARFQHAAETYKLSAGVHLEREALLAGRTARILVRPTLLLNGLPISLKVLEDPVLTIRSRDGDGVDAVLEVRDLALSAEREFVHEIQVPANLSLVAVSLRARVQSLTQARKIDVSAATRSFAVNQIDATPQTACPMLGRTPQGYVLDVLGKNGEPKAGRAVNVTVAHRDYTDSFTTTLKTDAAGRIRLGALDGIVAVKADGLPAKFRWWVLLNARRHWPTALSGVEGETLRVPYLGRASVISRGVVSLLERRGGTFVGDAFQHLALADGFLELRNLGAGDYSLYLKEPARQIRVRITRGKRSKGWAIGHDRMLQIARSAPLQVTSVIADGDHLQVKLANAGKDARVHLAATRYLAAFDPFAGLKAPVQPEPATLAVEHPESTYHSGREIGDEYRYILDRRFAKKFPGNMLERPGLLLNPWALPEDAANTAIGLGGGTGGAFGGRRGGRRSLRRRYGGGGGIFGGVSPNTFANLDFLPQAAVVLANLRADAAGVVRVPLAKLGSGQMIQVLAADDDDTVFATLTRAETKLEPRGRQLAESLPLTEHLSEQRRIEFVPAGGKAVVADAGTARAETYDSLASVYRLFAALSGDDDLAKFSFLLEWPQLTAEVKRAQYDKHACHELHFFLRQKDPAFFQAVVRPYLANKADKTFLDHWLLEADLSRYLDPWAFQRLNIVERILLARRIAGQSDSVRRHVLELFDLVPPDPQRFARLFDTALGSGALEAGEGITGQLAELKKSLERQRRPAQKPGAPATAAAAPSPRRSRAAKKDAKPAALRRKAKAKSKAEKGAEDEVIEEAEMEEEPAEDSSDAPLSADRDKARLDDVARRKVVRELYRAPDATKPYVESNYWHLRNTRDVAALIDANGFWRDFALAPADQPFVSTNFAEATGNFAEMMFALAVLDLPFAPEKHVSTVDGSRLTLQAKSPLLLVLKEIVPVQPGDARTQPPILVSQNYYRLDEPYRFEGSQRFDAFINDEFLVDVAYGCRVVVTNPSSSPRELELLLQIPSGAIPVKRGFFTRGRRARLDAFATTSIDYAFYFPATGGSQHYPVQVASGGKLVAFAAASALEVVAEPSEIDRTSWQYVSQNGTEEQVLAYLQTANLQRTDLGKIAWRMRDQAVFEKVLDRVSRRHVYADVLWSYGILHNDARVTREYLRHQDRFLAQCGMALTSPLVTIDPIERHTWQFIEYVPLFNARAHRFGKSHRILNRHLGRQYAAFLRVLGDRARLDDADWLSATYYLLLQDRVEDAMACFARVRPERLHTRVQYDYMRAYLDFFSAEHAVARGIAEGYRDYPVLHWRARFQDVLNHLDEAEGKAVAQGDKDNRTERQTRLAAEEPALDLQVEAQQVTLAYRNLGSVELRYYRMDVEFLFSTHPFVQQGSGSFAFIRPNGSETRNLPGDKTALTFELPREFQNANVLIEVHGGGITRRHAYYANSLDVTWMENYGQLKVAHRKDGRPLPTVYVKVFARMANGKVRFYKDGYTDLRGRFDYASLSASDTPRVAKFSILVLSEEHGAVIREVAPPAQ